MADSITDQRRVVVTGMGVISPIGNSVESLWSSLEQRHSGVTRSEELPWGVVAGQAAEFQGKIADFGDLEPGLKKTIRKALKLMNRETRMALAAAQQALRDSGLSASNVDVERVGVCFGTGNVGLMPQDFVAGVEACVADDDVFKLERWGQYGIPQVEPLWLLKCLPNMPSCHIAICNGFQGPNNSITQRDAAANLAVAESCQLIVDGEADVVVSGGTGTMLVPMNLMHTVMEHTVASTGGDPATVCRPFDTARSGAVVSEGAASLVLESLESALDRGATIYGEIRGVGSSCVVEPGHGPRCEASMANAMRMALQQAEAAADGIGHVHAHGLSTRSGDVQEAQAIRAVFGDRADSLPVTAAKSYTGNAGAGSGAIELVCSILAMQHRRLFPVLNCERPDPDCPIHPADESDVDPGDRFLNLSYLPTGQASCLLVEAVA